MQKIVRNNQNILWVNNVFGNGYDEEFTGKFYIKDPSDEYVSIRELIFKEGIYKKEDFINCNQ